MRKILRGRTLAILSILLISASVLIPGCKGKGGKTTAAEDIVAKKVEKETGEEARVGLEPGTLKVQTKEGALSVKETSEWPADIPREVPPFTLGKIRGVARMKGEDEQSWEVILGRLRKGALNDYRELLKGRGWTVEWFVENKEGGVIQAKKGPIQIVATFKPSGSGGSVEIAAPLEKPKGGSGQG